MITAVKVAVQARSEGFLVLHHVLGLAAARSEYNAGARQDGAPSPGCPVDKICRWSVNLFLRVLKLVTGNLEDTPGRVLKDIS